MLMVRAFLLVLFSTVALGSTPCEDDGDCTVKCYPVEGCGLSVPALPPRDSSLSVEQQWEEARAYWAMVMEVWESRAQQEGISQESAESAEMESSGSGQEMIEPDFSESEQSQTSWLQSLSRWEEQYTAWNQLIRDQNSGGLPDSTSQGILEGITADESASSIRSNSRSWSALTMDWNLLHTAYSTAYSGVCSS